MDGFRESRRRSWQGGRGEGKMARGEAGVQDRKEGHLTSGEDLVEVHEESFPLLGSSVAPSQSCRQRSQDFGHVDRGTAPFGLLHVCTRLGAKEGKQFRGREVRG